LTEPIRVLVADDHAMVRGGLKVFLDLQEDITVAGEAADGVEAVEQAKRLSPDVVLNGDYFGSAVILAARIAAVAHGGEILLSDATKAVAGRTTIPLVDRGEHRLRGLRDRCRLYEAVWRQAD
jgi:hypothetical protein